MSKCNLTRTIAETECIGDSLVKINTNFAVLDRKVCDVPTLTPGNGTDVSHNGSFVSVDTQNSFVYKNTFDGFANGVGYTPISISDDSLVYAYTFPNSMVNDKPYGTFTIAAPNSNSPKITLYWTGDGTNDTTVYATNSSASYANKGNTYFNDSVNSIHRIDNKLFIGGRFTEVGGTTQNKFVLLSAGTYNSGDPVGPTGTILPNPLSSFENGTLGQFGEVKVVTSAVYSRDGNTENNGLIVAGSFGIDPNNPNNKRLTGRGLIVVNLDESDYNKNIETFYVNGTVNCASVVQPTPGSSAGSYLLIGGDFDYISTDYSDTALGERVYTNGLAKIDLSYLSGPYAIDQNFANVVLSLFDGKAIINAICNPLFGTSEIYAQIHVGGIFKIIEADEVVAQNLVAINELGARKADWNPIVDGPIHALAATKLAGGLQTIYVGGKFNTISYGTSIFKRDNAAVIIAGSTSTTISESWIPSFNGPVTSFAFNSPTGSLSLAYVYCYGLFDRVNGKDVSYLAALAMLKAEGSPAGALQETWRPRLQRGPEPINSALAIWPSSNDAGHSLFVGGNFDTVNSKIRYKLARIEMVDPLAQGETVYWEVASQVMSNGDVFAFDNVGTNVVSVSSYAEPNGRITATSFPPLTAQTRGTKPGQLYRFRIKREGTYESLITNVNLIGWTLDFN